MSSPLSTLYRLTSSRLRRTLLAPFLRSDRKGNLSRLGSAACGWWIPEDALLPGAIAYCAGAGEDISFDLELHRRGLVVVTIDPTPRSIEYVKRVMPHDERFHFIPIGLWKEAGEMAFYAPSESSGVSHSALNLQGTTEHFMARVEPLKSIMDRLQHNHLDILKVDIEGAESFVLPHMLENGPHPNVVCFEFDQPQSARRLFRLLRAFRDAGYELRHREKWNFTLSRKTPTSSN